MIIQKKAERRRRRREEARSAALQQEDYVAEDIPSEPPAKENVHASPKRPSPKAAHKYGQIGDHPTHHHSSFSGETYLIKKNPKKLAQLLDFK